VIRILLLLLLAAPALAKTLHWKAIDVDARLDRDGNLHVVERQQIVFDGDWNGGERDFNTSGRQSVDVERIVRIDGTTEVPLTRGELDAVDRWDFAESDVIRWRSRLATDPPFANRELTYVLQYVYRDILIGGEGEGKTFRLDHDFGMPESEGRIERFTLRLSFDPIWGAAPVSIAETNLAAGSSVPVTRDLTYRGDGWPAGIERPIAIWIPLLVAMLFLVAIAALIYSFLRGERATGRFDPVVAHFDKDVLKLAPEVAGAVWDASVGAPEVSAVLARMAQEGKVKSRTEDGTLHLRLIVPRKSLSGYERELVAKLFYAGNDNTDTDSIRAHYSSSGFDPAKIIRDGIEMKLDRLPAWNDKVKRISVPMHVVRLVAALLLLVGGATYGEGDVLAAIGGFMWTGVFSLIACFTALHYSRSIANVTTALIAPLILLFAAAAPLLFACVVATTIGLHAPILFALFFWTLALAKLVLDLLRITDAPAKIAYRKRIAGARQYFIEQLELPKPDLRDEWFPYVLAFGLGPQVDRWFQSFAGASASSSSFASSSFSSSSSSSSSASSWTGGGGAFGGAGASGTWAVAAGAMAAGVSAPSSSGSSSGGGGSSSSSGGGGGGGW
jgi:hypothetical protein